jgi:glycosyltransferase involved in cell wall biosynthesis
MKIIAFIPAKNEEDFLPLCIKSLKEWVDEIIVYDDHSTDETCAIAKKFGCRVISENYKTDVGWPEYDIRERLLEEGRKLNGTHFVGIDADEIFTPAFSKSARTILEKMHPGDTLALRWITLWKDSKTERVDGVFNNLYKPFIFCDDGTSHHQYAFLGVGRVPYNEKSTLTYVDYELGGILHFQYVLWNKTQIKQAWYRCSELLKKERSARRINNMYSISLDGTSVRKNTLPKAWIPDLIISDIKIKDTWQYKQIILWFEKYGIEFFEPLQIWHIEELNNLFIEKTGRFPRPKIFPRWIILLNTVKNKIKNYRF